MKSTGKLLLLSIFFFVFAADPAAQARSQSRQPTEPQSRKHAVAKDNVLVGRISLVDGELLRYVPEQKDWVAAAKDTPFGLEDALYSGENVKAEFLLPNSTWIRIGASTQIQMIALKPDVTEVDVAVGTARLIDKSSKAIIKATTPFGYVVGQSGAAFDMYVGDESVEVIGIRGQIEFIHDPDGARYEVVPGSMSIVADARQATAGEGKVAAEWDDWNNSRDTFLAQSEKKGGQSARYLPEGIQEDAATLDSTGRWERVNYKGKYRTVWRPTTVASDWSPYTHGRWVDYYGDYCWVPDEPFGYVTHHYGYWFRANDYWYWSPPLVTAGVGAPWWGIGFSWYPGRVGWIYTDAYLGWFPLLPWEPYYSTYWWGPLSFVAVNPAVISINLGGFAFANRAFVVNQSALFRTTNLATAGVTGINRTTITSTFSSTAVPTSTTVRNASLSQRFNSTNTTRSTTLGSAATSRITANQTRINSARTVSAASVSRQVGSAPRGRTAAAGSVAAPSAASRLATGSTGTGQSRALKQNARAVTTTSSGVRTGAGSRRAGSTALSRGSGTGTAGSRQFGRSRTGGTSRSRVATGSSRTRSATGAGISRGSSRRTSGGSQFSTGRRGSSSGRSGVSRNGGRSGGAPSVGRGRGSGGPSFQRGSGSGPRSQRSMSSRFSSHGPSMQRGGPGGGFGGFNPGHGGGGGRRG